MWSALDTLPMIIEIYFEGWSSWVRSKDARCQSKYLKWCSVNGCKELNWSRDEADDISVRRYIIWMHMIFPLSRGEFIHHNCISDMPFFFIIHCLHEMCANRISCNCFMLAFGLVILGFTNANWYAQLRFKSNNNWNCRGSLFNK